jgi:DNA-binding NarL/FixJ family response regulator
MDSRRRQTAAKKDPKKVLIVDDHPVFREGLASILAREADLTIAAQANNARQALTALERLECDVVLLDLSLPDKGGLEFIKDLRSLYPSLPVLVVSMHDETLFAERVLRAGANGYVMKEEGPERILQAIRQVLRLQTFLSPKMSARILNALSGRERQHVSPISRLTDREFQILQLIGKGHDSRAIAHQLSVSYKTVDTHRGHIKEKLNLNSGMELICYAVRWVETQPTGERPSPVAVPSEHAPTRR